MKRNKQKKKKIDGGMTILWTFVYIGLFLIGFVMGMSYQQDLIKDGLIDVLTYTNLDINVNFNETKFVQELNNTFIPEIKRVFESNEIEELRK